MTQQAAAAVKHKEEPEISIWIDKYEDVFSDFDSRPFAERTLSDDFLREVQKMSSQKSAGNVRLKFHVLAGQGNTESESVIIANLNNHFRQIAEELTAEKKQLLHKGYSLIGIGFVLISIIFLLTVGWEDNAYLHGIILMLEPVAWFTTWTGLDHIFQHSKKENSDLRFNSRMANASITFAPFGMEETAGPQNGESRQHKTVIPLDNYNLRVA